ncbi:TetR/AcrR family transcriptional regulator [Nonomuraea sp. FMUSA5-5]|uniref:TetR/AcrR family transcriptional regulator n=1 Tax=Nonomuraea composti TaxID=2720023 RepID=A0ABX1AXY2_9ACTN|nr:TetR/AcrR family transcriptional regulator [Nonomuraea sp. FMUSA5-5]NJP88264.1 TetR/AcrR family transcriptional regulator [Nonomuraea sp. FMUSA5-5]
MTGRRADARRNYALLLDVAKEAIAEHGPDASLEQMARTAGVGSATLRRHFPTRQALLEAVFREEVETLCARARDLTAHPDTRAALLEWLHAVTAAATTIRGLAVALARERALNADTAGAPCCSVQLTEAGDPLVRRAAGALTPGVTTDDLLTLVTGIALAAEHHPDPAAEAERLLGLAITGVSPQ